MAATTHSTATWECEKCGTEATDVGHPMYAAPDTAGECPNCGLVTVEPRGDN